MNGAACGDAVSRGASAARAATGLGSAGDASAGAGTAWVVGSGAGCGGETAAGAAAGRAGVATASERSAASGATTAPASGASVPVDGAGPDATVPTAGDAEAAAERAAVSGAGAWRAGDGNGNGNGNGDGDGDGEGEWACAWGSDRGCGSGCVVAVAESVATVAGDTGRSGAAGVGLASCPSSSVGAGVSISGVASPSGSCTGTSDWTMRRCGGAERTVPGCEASLDSGAPDVGPAGIGATCAISPVTPPTGNGAAGRGAGDVAGVSTGAGADA